MDSVIAFLGTNAIDDNEDKLNVVKSAMSTVADKWPNARVAFSSIIPRRDKNEHMNAQNKNANSISSHRQTLNKACWVRNGVGVVFGVITVLPVAGFPFYSRRGFS